MEVNPHGIPALIHVDSNTSVSTRGEEQEGRRTAVQTEMTPDTFSFSDAVGG